MQLKDTGRWKKIKKRLTIKRERIRQCNIHQSRFSGKNKENKKKLLFEGTVDGNFTKHLKNTNFKCS